MHWATPERQVPTELSAATYKALSDLGVTMQQTGPARQFGPPRKFATSSAGVISTLSAYGKAYAESVSSMQTSGGMLSNRIDGLNALRSDALRTTGSAGYRIALIEKRYRAQFTTLDTFVKQMQSLSRSLSQSLRQSSSG